MLMARNVKYSVITKCINERTKVRLKTMTTLSIILITLVILSMAWTTFFYDTCHMYICIEGTMKKRYKDWKTDQTKEHVACLELVARTFIFFHYITHVVSLLLFSIFILFFISCSNQIYSNIISIFSVREEKRNN